MKDILNFKILNDDISQVSQVRIHTKEFIEGFTGFNEDDIAKALIIVSELSNNLVKHSESGGELIIRLITQKNNPSGIEIISLDKGPGMNNIAECLRDGHSTAGSMGIGLGAVMRMSSMFDIYSVPAQGTAILSLLFAKSHKLKPDTGTVLNFEVSGICIPKPGEEYCGDSWMAYQDDGICKIIVIDGLGHGYNAEEAANKCFDIFAKNLSRSNMEIIRTLHEELKDTRGVAAAIAEIDKTNERVLYAGVGNISGIIVSSGIIKNMVSYNGILGHNLSGSTKEFSYPWYDDSTLIMYTDGLKSNFGFDTYPSLINKKPGIISGVLYRDFARGYDDAAVVAVKGMK